MLADVGLFEFSQLQQQVALFIGNFLGNFNVDRDEQIARSATARVGHAAASNPKHFPGVRARRNVLRLLAIQSWNFDVRAQHRLRVCDRDVTNQVLAVSFKQVVLADANLDIQVTSRAAVHPRLPFATQAERHPGIDARRHTNIQTRLLGLATGTAAVLALVPDDLPFAAARRAGGLNAEKSLRLHDLTVTAAVIARRGS